MASNLPVAQTRRGRKLKLLSPAIRNTIISYIRAGAYAWVAAQAAGIHRATFWRWMQIGERHHERSKASVYRDFYYEVQQAQAEARAAAEIQVRRDRPETWLRYGPGRSRPGMPGWTAEPGINVQVTQQQAMIALGDLADDPAVREAERAFAEALRRQSGLPKRPRS